MKYHEKLTLLLLALWALCFASAVKAATVQDFMGNYDQSLTYWAAVSAVLGGMLRTIFSLQSDARTLWVIWPEALWDVAKALVAGLLAFFVIQALRSSGYLVPPEVRFAAVLVAGIMRFAAIFWMKDLGTKLLNAWAARAMPKILDDLATKPKDTP